MLAGEPGISKTRLAQELASRAQAEGARVLWGKLLRGRRCSSRLPGDHVLTLHMPAGPERRRRAMFVQEADMKGGQDLDKRIKGGLDMRKRIASIVGAFVVVAFLVAGGMTSDAYASGDSLDEAGGWYTSDP